MTLEFKGKVSIPNGVMVRQLSGESVLLNLNSESYFGLDDVGTRMWAVLTESASIEAAYELLLSEFEVEPAQLATDLRNFILELTKLGLVDVADC